MPVRSLNSSVLKWPDVQTVRQALQTWADAQLAQRPDILAIGYLGSYARGDWGVGSDLDLVILLENSSIPVLQRGSEWDTTTLPVPVDLLIYTRTEWASLAARKERISRVIQEETVWVYGQTPSSSD